MWWHRLKGSGQYVVDKHSFSLSQDLSAFPKQRVQIIACGLPRRTDITCCDQRKAGALVYPTPGITETLEWLWKVKSWIDIEPMIKCSAITRLYQRAIPALQTSVWVRHWNRVDRNEAAFNRVRSRYCSHGCLLVSLHARPVIMGSQTQRQTRRQFVPADGCSHCWLW